MTFAWDRRIGRQGQCPSKPLSSTLAEVPQHSHPAHVIYVVDDCKVKFSYPNGESEELELKAGQTLWSDGVTHTPQNTGTSELHALNIELKE